MVDSEPERLAYPSVAQANEQVERYQAENKRLHELNRRLRENVAEEKEENCILQARWAAEVKSKEAEIQGLFARIAADAEHSSREKQEREEIAGQMRDDLRAQLDEAHETLGGRVEELSRTLKGLQEYRENKDKIEAELARVSEELATLTRVHKQSRDEADRGWILTKNKLQKQCSAAKMQGVDTSLAEAALKPVAAADVCVALLALALEGGVQQGAAAAPRPPRAQAAAAAAAVDGDGADIEAVEDVAEEDSLLLLPAAHRPRRPLQRQASGSSLPKLARLPAPPPPRRQGQGYSRWRYGFEGMWQPGMSTPPAAPLGAGGGVGRPHLPRLSSYEAATHGYQQAAQTERPRPSQRASPRVNSILGLPSFSRV
jgi:hypothetical protein